MLLILASNSPRRRELLTQMGHTFTIIPADIDESPRQGEQPESYVTRMALEKASAVASLPQASASLVLSADTTVILGSKILGKPLDAKEAHSMLQELSGKTHQVITAFCIIRTTDFAKHEESVITTVTFRPLTNDEIADYVATKEPLDKAGAYAIQGQAGQFAIQINGDLDNVIGLPCKQVEQALKTLKL